MKSNKPFTFVKLLALQLVFGSRVLLIPIVSEPSFEELENIYDETILKSEDGNRNAVKASHQIWPSTVLYYKTAANYTSKEIDNLQDALQYFNEHTCLKFEPYEKTQHSGEPYIHYKTSDKMCGTKVGYNRYSPGKSHDVILNSFCAARKGIIQHETLHVLGLYHEQSRPDRNNYVSIDYSNIPPQYWPQFAIKSNSEVTTYDVVYDYDSIMHYSKNAFARNPDKPTILAKEGKTIFERDMGQIIAPSNADLTKIRKMYGCDK